MGYCAAMAIAACAGDSPVAPKTNPNVGQIAHKPRMDDYNHCAWVNSGAGWVIDSCWETSAQCTNGYQSCSISCESWDTVCLSAIPVGGGAYEPGCYLNCRDSNGDILPVPPPSYPEDPNYYPPPADFGSAESCYPQYDQNCRLLLPTQSELSALHNEVARLRALRGFCTQLADAGDYFLNDANGNGTPDLVYMYTGPGVNAQGDTIVGDTHSGQIHISRRGFNLETLSDQDKAYRTFRHELKHRVAGWPNPDDSAHVPADHKCD